MKKYKLVKEYPGSPKLNTIIESVKSCLGYTCVKTKDGKLIDTKDFKNFPEFWQEIVEKQYEIISIICPDIRKEPYIYDGRSSFIHKKFAIIRLERVLSGSLLSNNQFPIYIQSVKRLSDSEIFTVGDNTNFGIIQSIDIQDIKYNDSSRTDINTISFGVSKDDEDPLLEEIQKVKKPLFTTLDGVNIFDENDIVFEVFKHNLELNKTIPLKACNNIKSIKGVETLIFAKLNNAVDYIVMNTPSLSLTDIVPVVPEYWFNKLKKQIESKLNL